MVTEHPPEQERAKEIAERWLAKAETQTVSSRTEGMLTLAREYLALLAAYEDRSAAFERAATDCVRLEELRETLQRWCDEDGGSHPGFIAIADVRMALEQTAAEDEQHHAEHLREAREVEQHQEEKHGE